MGRIGKDRWSNPEFPLYLPGLDAQWLKYYSRERRAAWTKLFDRAAAKVAADSPEARRVAFFRSEFLEPMLEKGAAHDEEMKLGVRVPDARNLLKDPKPEYAIEVKPGAKANPPFLPANSAIIRLREPMRPDTEYVVHFEYELDVTAPGHFFVGVNTVKNGWWPQKYLPNETLPRVGMSYRFRTDKKVPPLAEQYVAFTLRGIGSKARVYAVSLSEGLECNGTQVGCTAPVP